MKTLRNWITRWRAPQASALTPEERAELALRSFPKCC
ncbi:hypothetical protein CLV88_102247 [Shimia abyssi]|uniref:Uncharacterized protein n=1 Tax=Shimia abyssi TaxID=1662395 RepID=A0A2P8FHC9_9RHOB|nr:hypothetical protein CLV88_102247 [Shimia abyssi]